MAWKIDRDYLDSGTEDSQVGRASLGLDLIGPTFGFRIRDDDDVIYYHGIADERAAEELEDEYGNPDQGSLYEANKWGEWFAGAPWLDLRRKDAERLGFASPNPNAALDHDSDEAYGNEWVSIYA